MTVIQGLSMPGITKKLSESSAMDNYTVHWKKFDLSDEASILELSLVETRALKGDEVIIISSDKFTFMDRYFVIIKFMEKNV